MKDRIELIEEAQDLIAQAQALVDQACQGTDIEDNYRAYGRYGFDQLQGNGNSYDSSLSTLMEDILEEDEDE